MINLLKSKIQELIVNESSLDYPESISLPSELVEAAKLHEFEQVFVNNKTTGERISTYVVISKYPGFVSFRAGRFLWAIMIGMFFLATYFTFT